MVVPGSDVVVLPPAAVSGSSGAATNSAGPRGCKASNTASRLGSDMELDTGWVGVPVSPGGLVVGRRITTRAGCSLIGFILLEGVVSGMDTWAGGHR